MFPRRGPFPRRNPYARPQPAVTVVLAVAQPVLVVGLAGAGSHLSAHGSSALGLLLILAGMAAWASGIFLEASPGPVFAAAVATMFAWLLVQGAVATAVLEERGIAATCTVLAVAERTETSTGTDADGHPYSTTDTYYDYRVGCVDGHAESYTRTYREADVGDRLDLVYDPAGRVAPRQVKDLSDPVSALELTGVLVGVAVLLRLLGVWREWR